MVRPQQTPRVETGYKSRLSKLKSSHPLSACTAGFGKCFHPQGSVRPFHQKSTCFTILSSGTERVALHRVDDRVPRAADTGHSNQHICVRAARPSGRARCGACAGCWAIKYQSLWQGSGLLERLPPLQPPSRPATSGGVELSSKPTVFRSHQPSRFDQMAHFLIRHKS